MMNHEPYITVRELTMAYNGYIVQRDLNFNIKRGEVFIIMGGSGCGKSTLLRHLVGLHTPAKGDIYYGDVNFWKTNPSDRDGIMKKIGILYQTGALWSSMTLGENVALPLEAFTDLSGKEIKERVSLKLSLVGLAGFESYYPAELSGGMRKRAGLARAMALDPDILYFDEPTAGLDPVSAHHLDVLILELKKSLGSTVVVVTHELTSIFAIGDDSIFLDPETKTIIAAGDPKILLEESRDPKVRRFLTRGEEEPFFFHDHLGDH
jgi:phospholipid/cholesterol/gamma-HCH transport system ATP-binding protein